MLLVNVSSNVRRLIGTSATRSFTRIGLLILLLTIPASLVAYYNGRTFAKRMYDVFINLDDNEKTIFRNEYEQD